ncbi:hypothetical protein [Polaromonas sp. YR568]|uniref:hypothetical protein n=1 Tax=Polaromonas sp. YR568 TaxID=1855301 RepID=UPI00398BEF9A
MNDVHDMKNLGIASQGKHYERINSIAGNTKRQGKDFAAFMSTYILGAASNEAGAKLEALRQIFLQQQAQVFNASDTRNRMLFFAFGDTGNNKGASSLELFTKVVQVRFTLGALWSFMRCAFAVLLIGALNACATAQHSSVEHGINVENKGVEIISDVLVLYGALEYRDCSRGCAKTGGAYYGAYMPIQEEMA